MFNLKTKIIFLFLFGCVISQAAFAGLIVVDQSQNDVDGHGFFVTSPATYSELNPRWQEFTPSFNNIERFDFFMYDQHRVNSTLTVWLTDINNAVLWTVDILDSVIPEYGWLTIDTPSISVVPGMAYRVNMTVDQYPNDGLPSASVFWMGSISPTTYFLNDASGDWWTTYSYAFKVYAAIPEPKTYIMLLIGLGLLGFIANRKKQNFN